MPVDLTQRDQDILAGHEGAARQLAMEIVVQAADITGAPHLIDVSFLHIDACHYYGRVHVDLARHLADLGAAFDIPAWTNTIPVNLQGRDLRPGADTTFREEAADLARLYEAMGARPVWTCAPYQLPGGPKQGEHIIGSESNAVAYYNSVVGARTNKYGDFLEVSAGLVARTPYCGLHTDEGRCGTLLFDVSAFADALKSENLFHHVLGHLVGKRSGSGVPVISGLLPETNPDQLKAISAAVAASGGVGLFHAVGVTPEAPDLETAFQGRKPRQAFTLTPDDLIQARDELSTANDGPVSMVSVGTPHFSFTEFRALTGLIAGRRVHRDTAFYATTSRFIRDMIASEGWLAELEEAGVIVVADTCTYFTPAVQGCQGRVMTNSAKWAYYAPGLLPVDGVVFGSLKECVETAVRGTVWRDADLWRGTLWGLS